MQAPDPARDSARAQSVTALTQRLKGVVEGAFANVRVEGEISNAKVSGPGHIWFSLRDSGAELPAVIWGSIARRLAVEVRDGKKMAASGDIEIYAPHGRYQLIVRSIRDAGLGERLAELEALRRSLSEEGLFADDRKKPLPLLPRRVGIVTSETGDALRDILTTLNRRFPTRVLLAPARVQGEEAAREIAQAIDLLDAHPEVDVIIVGRGGGSIEDLWAFNEEGVARAIARAQTPIVSAVGHEPDHLLSDDVADMRAATPTAAAELVVPSRNDLLQGLDGWVQGMVRRMEHRFEGGRTRQEGLARGLSLAMERRIRTARSRHGQLSARLRNLHPRQRLATERAAVGGLSSRLALAGRATLLSKRHRLARAKRALEVLSPIACLDRGYAIVRGPDGSVVSRAESVKPGTSLRVVLHRGALHATVDRVEARHELEGDEP
jgi:exodeoxyribonuclease VII large subunit